MLDNSDQINVVVVDNRVVQFSVMPLTCLYWSIHCIYVIRRRCRQIFPETAMQLIYCKCRSVSFWIYIFLNSISSFQHKGETKVDVLSVIYVAYWNDFLTLWVPPGTDFKSFILLKCNFLLSTTISVLNLFFGGFNAFLLVGFMWIQAHCLLVPWFLIYQVVMSFSVKVTLELFCPVI